MPSHLDLATTDTNKDIGRPKLTWKRSGTMCCGDNAIPLFAAVHVTVAPLAAVTVYVAEAPEPVHATL
jgi:hypothetical protein